jgi:hypothetical protein
VHFSRSWIVVAQREQKRLQPSGSIASHFSPHGLGSDIRKSPIVVSPRIAIVRPPAWLYIPQSASRATADRIQVAPASAIA